jgi:hypothetical protein
MTIGLLPDDLPDDVPGGSAGRRAERRAGRHAGRRGTGDSLRQNAVDPGFHGVPSGPARRDRDADGAGGAYVRFLERAARPPVMG